MNALSPSLALSQNLADQELTKTLVESIISKKNEEWIQFADRLRNRAIYELEVDACRLEEAEEDAETDAESQYKRPSDLQFLIELEKIATGYCDGVTLADAIYSILMDDMIMGCDKILDYLTMPEFKLIKPSSKTALFRMAISRLNYPVIQELIKYALEDETCNIFCLQIYLPYFAYGENHPAINQILEFINGWIKNHEESLKKRAVHAIHYMGNN